jgi:hypothetical protein
MSFTHRLVLHGTALALSALLLSAEAHAQAQQPAPEKEQDRTVGAGSPQSTPSPAPIGHRQPKASDLPSVVPKDPSDEWLTRINRELDRKIQICRGC